MELISDEATNLLCSGPEGLGHRRRQGVTYQPRILMKTQKKMLKAILYILVNNKNKQKSKINKQAQINKIKYVSSYSLTVTLGYHAIPWYYLG
jgi:hypothetical protein